MKIAFVQDVANEDFCHLLGLLAGDGSVRTNGRSGNGSINYRATFHTTSPLLRETFSNLAENIGFHPRIYPVKIRSPSKKQAWQVKFQSVDFFHLFHRLKEQRFAPVMSKAFLRGFYEAEGNICWYKAGHRRVALYNNDQALLKEISGWLRNAGYKPWLHARVKNHGFKPDGTLRWEIRLVGNPQVTSFLELIDPLIKRMPN